VYPEPAYIINPGEIATRKNATLLQKYFDDPFMSPYLADPETLAALPPIHVVVRIRFIELNFELTTFLFVDYGNVIHDVSREYRCRIGRGFRSFKVTENVARASSSYYLSYIEILLSMIFILLRSPPPPAGKTKISKKGGF